MGTPLELRSRQASEVISRLSEEYPDSSISLIYSNRLELLISVILSAQCTDERVNQVTDNLFDKFQSLNDFASASEDEIADMIDSVTYYNNKARYIRNACQMIRDYHNGEVPETMEELTNLPGVGRKTANVVLQHGHNITEGIVVDTHVQRQTRRLGLTDHKRPEKIERELMDYLPQNDWQQFTHLLIDHGRAVCTARSPSCHGCVLSDICPSEQGDSKVDLATGEEWN